jgi:hypothetical protein
MLSRALVYAVLSFSCLAQAGMCKLITPPDGGMKGRQLTIEFPSGRKITLVGHIHGNVERTARVIPAISNQGLSNEEYVENLNQILTDDKPALKHYQEDVEFLKESLSKKEYSFVALESGPGETKLFEALAKDLNERSISEFNRRKIQSGSLRRNSILLVSTPVFYQKQFEPGLYKNVEILGAEDADLLSKSYEEMVALTDAEKKLTSKAPETKEDILEVSRWLQNEYFELDDVPDKEVIDSITKNAPQNLKQDVAKYVESGLKAYRTIRKRDKYISNQLLSKDGSGLLLIGQAHLRSIGVLILQECERQSAPNGQSRVVQGAK